MAIRSMPTTRTNHAAAAIATALRRARTPTPIHIPSARVADRRKRAEGIKSATILRVRGRASLSSLALALATAVVATPVAAHAQTPAPRLPTLTTIGAIRALSQDEGARGYQVRVRGIVTHIDELADVSLIVHDGRAQPPLLVALRKNAK